MTLRPLLRLAVLAVAVATAGAAVARDRVRIAGSDFIAPFAVVAAEAIGGPGAAADVATGPADAAFRAFCTGVGEGTPDAVGSTRPMTDAEAKACAGAGVTAIADLAFGRDAIVLVRHPAAPPMAVTRAQLFSAVAAKVLVDGQLVANSYARWSEIDPGLPDLPIRVIGPPPGSDAAAAFAALVLEPGCRSTPALQELPPEAGDICRALRKDGAFVPATGGTAAAIRAAADEPGTLAATSYAAVVATGQGLVPLALDGVVPGPETIADGRYGPVVDLHLVVKNAHRTLVPVFDVFLRVFVSEEWIGPEGSLVRRGLVPVGADLRGRLRQVVGRAAPSGGAG